MYSLHCAHVESKSRPWRIEIHIGTLCNLDVEMMCHWYINNKVFCLLQVSDERAAVGWEWPKTTFTFKG